VVIGIGNTWRGDDGAGPAVAAAVRRRTGDRLAVLELDGEAARLVDAWDGAELAVVVDAVRTGAAPGTLHRRDPLAAGPALGRAGPGGTGAGPPASSHGLGVQEAVALGGALGRLPGRLVVIGVEGARFGHGDPLDPAVAAAVEPAARLVVDLVDGQLAEEPA
jgi:hydrogenase maturation protease